MLTMPQHHSPHIAEHMQGHNTTDFMKWYKTDKQYPVDYTERWEQPSSSGSLGLRGKVREAEEDGEWG